MEWETSDEGIHRQIPDTKIHRFAVSGIPGRAAGPGPTSTAIGSAPCSGFRAAA